VLIGCLPFVFYAASWAMIGEVYCPDRVIPMSGMSDMWERAESPLARQISKGMTEERVVKLLGDPDGSLCLNKLATKNVYYSAHGVTLSYDRDNRVVYIYYHRHKR
jgi:hypothetical protein